MIIDITSLINNTKDEISIDSIVSFDESYLKNR